MAERRRRRKQADDGRTTDSRPSPRARPEVSKDAHPDVSKDDFYTQDAWHHTHADLSSPTDPSADLNLIAAHIRRSITRRPADINAAIKALNALTRAGEALQAPNKRKHLLDHMTALLNDLGDQILPPDR